jgi:hypothetical protein
MSRVVTCGAEGLAVPDATASHMEGEGLAFVLGSNPTAGLSIETAAPISGRGSFKFTSPTADAAIGWSQAYVTDRDYFWSPAFQFSAAPAAQTVLAVVRDTAFAVRATVELTTARTLVLRSGAGTVLGTSAVLAAATPHRFTLHYRAPSVSGPGTAGLWVMPARGTEVEVVAQGTTLTGNTSAVTAPGRFDLYVTANNGITVLFDDVILNDGTGTAENARPTDERHVLLRPVSDSARVGFTGGAGATTNLFDAVDNTPPVGVSEATATATSQIKDLTTSTTDTYDAQLAAFTAALTAGGGGLSVGDGVKLVSPLVVYAPGAGGTAPQVGLVGVSNPVLAETVVVGGTTAAGTYPSGWRTSRGAVAYSPAPTLTTGPVLRARKAAAPNTHIALLGMYVAYTPLAGGGGGGGGGGGPVVTFPAPARVVTRNAIKAQLLADGTTLAKHLFELTADPKANVTDQIGSSAQLSEAGTTVFNADSNPSAAGAVPYNVGPAVTPGGGGATGVPDPASLTITGVALHPTDPSLAVATLTLPAATGWPAGVTPNASPYGFFQTIAGVTTQIGAWRTTASISITFPTNTPVSFDGRYRDNTATPRQSNPVRGLPDPVTVTSRPAMTPLTGYGVAPIVAGGRFSWDDPPAAQAIEEVHIYVWLSSGGSKPATPQVASIGTLSAGKRYADVTGLTPGALYSYEMRPARNE